MQAEKSSFITGLLFIIFICTASSAMAASTAGNVTKKRALTADSDMDNWMTYGRAYGDQRFSHLEQINKYNVSKLGLDWYVDIPSKDGLSATPIVVDVVTVAAVRVSSTVSDIIDGSCDTVIAMFLV